MSDCYSQKYFPKKWDRLDLKKQPKAKKVLKNMYFTFCVYFKKNFRK